MTPITTIAELEALPAETLLRGGQPGYGPAYVLIWDAGDGRMLYSDCAERGYLDPAEVIRIHAPLTVVQSPDPSPTVLALAQALATRDGKGAAFTSTTRSETSAEIASVYFELAEQIAVHLPAPTVKPGRDEIAKAIFDSMVNSIPQTAGSHFDDPAYSQSADACRRDADAVLAILPGKTEAQVRAEAWGEGYHDGQRQGGEGDDGPRYVNPYRANEEARK